MVFACRFLVQVEQLFVQGVLKIVRFEKPFGDLKAPNSWRIRKAVYITCDLIERCLKGSSELGDAGTRWRHEQGLRTTFLLTLQECSFYITAPTNPSASAIQKFVVSSTNEKGQAHILGLSSWGCTFTIQTVDVKVETSNGNYTLHFARSGGMFLFLSL